MFIGLILSLGMSANCLLSTSIVGYLEPRSNLSIVLKFARHQWDIPACWFDASYMKVSQSRNDTW